MSSPTPIVAVLRECIARVLAGEGQRSAEAMRGLGCAWCSNAIRDGQQTTEVAQRLLHDDPCLREFAEWTSPQPIECFEITASGRSVLEEEPPESVLPPLPLEDQLRKSVELGYIQDDDIVEWGAWVDEDTPNERYEREPVRWGNLSCYERHTVEIEADGRLAGGFPF